MSYNLSKLYDVNFEGTKIIEPFQVIESINKLLHIYKHGK